MSDIQNFIEKLESWPSGFTQGQYEGSPYTVTIERSQDEKRLKLFARSLREKDHVSFNLYYLNSGTKLKPCEMPEEKVLAFVLGFKADT